MVNPLLAKSTQDRTIDTARWLLYSVAGDNNDGFTNLEMFGRTERLAIAMVRDAINANMKEPRRAEVVALGDGRALFHEVGPAARQPAIKYEKKDKI